MLILRPHAARFHEPRISSAAFGPRAQWTINKTSLWRQSALDCRLGYRLLFVRFWASREATFPKMGDSLPRTPINHRAKFDAAIFILAKEIRNRTNKQENKLTNRNRYIHTCLSACVDNKYVGPPIVGRVEMYDGRVACCPLVSHVEYAPRALLMLEKTGQTDGRTPDCYFTLYAARVIIIIICYTQYRPTMSNNAI